MTEFTVIASAKQAVRCFYIIIASSISHYLGCLNALANGGTCLLIIGIWKK